MFTIRCRLEWVTSASRPYSAAYSRICCQRSLNTGGGAPSVWQRSRQPAPRRIATAHGEHGAPPRHEVEARPLERQQERVPEGEARETDRPQLHAARPGRDGGQRHDGLQARLGGEVVTDPDRPEVTRRLGPL